MKRRCIRVVSAEIQREGRYLITRRPSHAVLPDLWEFPGGRVREDEDDAAALNRALEKRIGVQVRVGEQVLEVCHGYDDYDVILAVYRCDPGPAEPEAGSVAALAWVEPEKLADYAFPGADQATIEALVGALEP